MRLKNFDYFLPKALIAQEPVKPRDSSRLLVLNRKTGKMEHKHFYDITEYLQPGDVLVLNNTKVIRARLLGRKAETGGKIEVFLLRPHPFPLSKFGEGCERSERGEERGVRGEVWQCLIGGKGGREGLKINFAGGLKAEVVKDNYDGTSAGLSAGTWQVKFNKSGRALMKVVEKIGQVPLPPYIKRNSKLKSQISKLVGDKISYQTVYADDGKLGSVAAPTAGLHFTRALLNQLKKKGVQVEYLTLHVGLGTFAPVKVDDITKHKMHEEWAEIGRDVLERIVRAKLTGRRIVAVGTTSVRALESSFRKLETGNWKFGEIRFPISDFRFPDLSFWTNLFIYPPYQFKVVDALITNFHLPKSTLLMLVGAFAGTERSRSAGKNKIFKAYRAAIKKKYRFYSYGDAMLII
jgi:S-adenosylmethionine:tRNA ribosyltransferase-isomerase